VHPHRKTARVAFPRGGRLLVAQAVLLLAVLASAAAEEASTADPEPRPIPAPDGRVGGIDDETLERLLELHHAEQEAVRLVLVPAVVTNRRNRVISGLESGDFRLLEDFVPQQIRYFGTETSQSIAISFLLDVSGSMRQVGKLDEAKEAIRTFVDSLREGDRFGLICFADDQVSWVTEFTSDRQLFLGRLGVQQAYGQTALFDALAATPRLVDEGIRGRKAIVLFTDGNDNASKMNTFKAVRLARSVEVPIYVISFSSLSTKLLPKGSSPPDIRVLRRFAQETGGSIWSVSGPADLKEAVLRIQEELRFQYVIGYHPTRQNWDGSFRRLKLETARGGLNVKARAGYYANP
jgi:Ca-activated chloride channel family protein